MDLYAKIGLKRNPFFAPDELEIPFHLWLDFGFSQPPQVQDNLFLQIIGQKGAGKTSHLLHWRQQTGGIYYYCPRGWQRWQFPPVQAIAYWDEANRIAFPLLLIALWKASQKKATIVAATHVNLSWIARLVKLSVKTIYLETLSVETLIAWTQKRIEAERLSPLTPVQLTLTPEKATEIISQSQGSWRTAAVYLHIWAATKALVFT